MSTAVPTPFILKFAEPVAPSRTPGFYDRDNQVWVAPEGLGSQHTLRTSVPERTDEIDQGPGV
jgi:hypothetical protein